MNLLNLSVIWLVITAGLKLSGIFYFTWMAVFGPFIAVLCLLALYFVYAAFFGATREF